MQNIYGRIDLLRNFVGNNKGLRHYLYYKRTAFLR